jgi:hypothetical protein
MESAKANVSSFEEQVTVQVKRETKLKGGGDGFVPPRFSITRVTIPGCNESDSCQSRPVMRQTEASKQFFFATKTKNLLFVGR